MEDLKKRLKIEFSNLLENINKLELFINSDKFQYVDNIQKSLLIVQLKAMKTYATCLDERITYL